MPYRIAPVISGRPNDPCADPDRLRYPPAVRKSAPELLRLIPKAHRVLVAAAAVQTSRKTVFEASAVLSAVDASKYRDKAVGSKEPLNKSAAALSGSFAPTYWFENLEIHKVFLRFPNLNLE